jgi:hypothetical protein
MGEVYKYKYKYKYKYGYEEGADQWQGREPYDDRCVEEPEEPVRRQSGRYIRVKSSISPYANDIVRVKIGYELHGRRHPHPETTDRIPELARGQQRTFQIPLGASHIDVEIEELILVAVPPYAFWPRLCFYGNVSLPFCIDIKSKIIILTPKCEKVKC